MVTTRIVFNLLNMKKSTLLLMSIGIFVCFKVSQAQFYGETLKVYQEAKRVLESDFAKQKFPPKIAKLTAEDDLPDTITVDDVRLFNFGKVIRSKEGKVEKKYVPIILKVINADSDISTEEKALLDAIKNSKPLTIYSSKAGNEGYPVNVTFRPEAQTKELLESFYQNGVSINSYQHMHLHFVDARKINNWLEYYHGSEQQKELAIAFMHIKFLEIKVSGGTDYKRFTRLFKNFIHGIESSFSRRDRHIYPESNRNIVLNMIKEFDESGHIALPDFMYMERMKK